MNALNEVKDLVSGGLVQVAGGFVGKQQPRVIDKSAGQGYALLFSAGELTGAMIAAVFQAYFAEPVGRQFRGFSFSHTPCEQRHGDIFLRREFRQQIVELPHVADFAIAEGRGLPGN